MCFDYFLLYVLHCLRNLITYQHDKFLLFSKIILTLFIVLVCHPAFPENLSDNMILDYKTVVKVEKGKLVQEKTIYIQINNKQADWISDIEISYGEDDKLEILEASILNKSGELVRSLKKKEIVTKSDISNGIFYENNFVQEFKLKWHEYPYFIRYSYRHTTDNFLYIARWYPILYKSVPVLRASLEVYIPKEMKVFMNSTDSIKHTVDSTIEGDKYTWTSSYTDQIKNQPFDLNIMERIPCVGIVPEQFKYSLDGSFKSWATYGLWQSQIIDGLDELTLSEQKMVDNMVTGITDKKEIIKRLYYYLQDNTRYINVAIDEGGMIPYPASYVCTNKYGDCKALTIYMKALLKYAEIPSYYTLVNAGVNAVKIEKDFPSQQFNHVILSIPLEKDTIWLENTSKYMPFNYLGTFTQNRYGLFINGNDSRLVKLPPLDMASVENKSTYQFLLDSDGNGSITLNKNLKGYAFEAYSYINKELDLNKQKDEILEDIYVKNIENMQL